MSEGKLLETEKQNEDGATQALFRKFRYPPETHADGGRPGGAPGGGGGQRSATVAQIANFLWDPQFEPAKLTDLLDLRLLIDPRYIDQVDVKPPIAASVLGTRIEMTVHAASPELAHAANGLLKQLGVSGLCDRCAIKLAEIEFPDDPDAPEEDGDAAGGGERAASAASAAARWKTARSRTPTSRNSIVNVLNLAAMADSSKGALPPLESHFRVVFKMEAAATEYNESKRADANRRQLEAVVTELLAVELVEIAPGRCLEATLGGTEDTLMRIRRLVGSAKRSRGEWANSSDVMKIFYQPFDAGYGLLRGVPYWPLTKFKEPALQAQLFIEFARCGFYTSSTRRDFVLGKVVEESFGKEDGKIGTRMDLCVHVLANVLGGQGLVHLPLKLAPIGSNGRKHQLDKCAGPTGLLTPQQPLTPSPRHPSATAFVGHSFLTGLTVGIACGGGALGACVCCLLQVRTRRWRPARAARAHVVREALPQPDFV